MLASLLCLALSALAAEPAAKPKLAVVIDDFGLTYPSNVKDEEWMKQAWPATFAVMPESPRTKAAAEQTKTSGHELIIHFPFDPFLALDIPKDKVSDGDLEKVSKLLEKSFAQIPGAVGLNNHRSLRATKNRPLMAAFMKLLKPRGVYFLDSKVTEKSVASEEARKAGVPTARNYIFLEEPGRFNDKAFAARMLHLAAARAKRDGQAVVIGHHYYHGTFDALVQEVPKIQAEGIQLVYASAVVR